MKKMSKKAVSVLLVTAVLSVSACGKSEPVVEKNASEASEPQKEEVVYQEEKMSSTGGSAVVYFSRVGNTDFPDEVDALSSASIIADGSEIKGNAQMIAEWIAEEDGCETFEIVAEIPYPADYNETVDLAKDEQSQKARPKLKSTFDFGGYDTIYIVYPNWWADLPMAVYTFFDEYDFSDKTINVFVTHEGSRFSNTVKTIGNLEPDAVVREGLSVRGGSVAGEEENIRQWVRDN